MTPLKSFMTVALMLAAGSTWAAARDPIYHRPAEMANLPFSEAVAHRGVLYLSGQVGLGADRKLVPGGIGPETKQVMDNIVGVLKKHDLGMDRVIKCTVFLADIKDWPAFNDIYTSYLDSEKLPARSALAASGLAFGAKVELECIAALGQSYKRMKKDSKQKTAKDLQ